MGLLDFLSRPKLDHRRQAEADRQGRLQQLAESFGSLMEIADGLARNPEKLDAESLARVEFLLRTQERALREHEELCQWHDDLAARTGTMRDTSVQAYERQVQPHVEQLLTACSHIVDSLRLQDAMRRRKR